MQTAAIREVLREKLKMPSVLRNRIALVIRKLDLGTRPPRVGGARVLTSYSNITPVEAHIMWGSDMALKMTVAVDMGAFLLTIPLAVDHVVFNGVIRLNLSWSHFLPCLSKVGVTFSSLPDVRFDLSVIGPLEAASLPVVRSLVGAAVRKSLSKKFIYPNVHVVTMKKALRHFMAPCGELTT